MCGSGFVCGSASFVLLRGGLGFVGSTASFVLLLRVWLCFVGFLFRVKFCLLHGGAFAS